MTDGGDARPFVSIVVPVYNDPDGVRTTLDSLTSLDYPSDRYEVLVVDNDSTDETPAVVESFAEDHETVTLLFEREIQGSYAARNTGIEAAEGDVLAFVDADMHVDPEWLDEAVDELAAADADYMGCHVELYTPDDRTTLGDRYNAASGFDIERYVEELSFAPTCGLFVRRSVFEEVGRFDRHLISSGDLEFGNRVADAGYDLHYAEDVTMYHPTRSSVRSNVKKGVRIGRGRFQLSQRYPDRYGSPVRKLCDPFSYLPPAPSNLDATFRDWDDRALREKLELYVMATVTTYARAYGRLKEAVATVVGDRRPPSRPESTGHSD